mgnify:CR=1 FL=1
MAVGGGTTSPKFYNQYSGETQDTTECFESPLAFVILTDDNSNVEETSPTSIKWSKFFGGPQDLKFSEVGTITLAQTMKVDLSKVN